MSHQIVEPELFIDLSDEQQELVTGGGPTLGAVEDFSQYLENASPVFSSVSAGPLGATATGSSLPTEILSYATQLALGASGNPTFPSSFPGLPSAGSAPASGAPSGTATN